MLHMANERSNFFSLLEMLLMLGVLTMSSDILFHTMIMRTEKKSAQALTLELGTNNLVNCLEFVLHY